MSIYDKATLVQIPSGYKASGAKLYSVLPANGDGDFTVSSDADATRINSDGLVESVSANQARLDYDPSNPQDPHLLLEPTRTNLITQSETYTTTSKVNLSVSDNTSISDPQGGANAKTLTATSTSQPRLEWRGTAVPASNTSYAMSFWVRYNTARYVAIAHFSQTGEYAIFDLVDGSVESDAGTQTAKIEKYQNGWYRISKSFQVPSSASLNYWKFTLCTQTNAFLGVSGEKADVFGLQLEEGTYSTSLIETSGLAVTRTRDNVYNGGDSTLFDLDELTFFVDVTPYKGSTFHYVSLTDGSNQNRIIFIFNNNNTSYTARVVSSGSTQLNDTENITFETRNKIAIALKANDTKVYLNGSQVAADTTFTMPVNLDRLNFSIYANSNNFFEGKVHQVMVFNERLSDSELQTLTS